MARTLRFTGLFLLALFAAENTRAQALIVQFSDSHSSYARMPLFLRSLSRLRAEYRAREPHGKLILAVNGDFAGASPLADDQGNLAYEVLGTLAQDWEIVLNLGNHEGFDWRGETGQRLFLSQNERLQELIPGFRITTANLELSRRARDLFQPHHDITMASGERVRFHGFILRRLFRVSNISLSAPTQTILAATNIEDAIRSGLDRAREESVRTNIILLHDSHDQLETHMGATLRWRGQRRARRDLNLPIAFSGHDHQATQTQMEGTLLVNSGSEFDFSTVELDAQGNVARAPIHFGRSKQEELIRGAPPPQASEARSLVLVESYLPEVLARLETVVATTNGFPDAKANMKTERIPLGTAIADAMAIWARERLARDESIEYSARWLPVVAFFNSSSYRRDIPIPAGPFLEADLRSFFPFANDGMGVYLVTGTELRTLFRDLREQRKKEQSYSPQMSGNLREVDDLELEFRQRLGGWSAVEAEDRFVLVADPWLAANGFELPEWQRLLERGTTLIAPGPSNTPFLDAIRAPLARCERFILGAN